jgi:hypothetical protein
VGSFLRGGGTLLDFGTLLQRSHHAYIRPGETLIPLCNRRESYLTGRAMLLRCAVTKIRGLRGPIMTEIKARVTWIPPKSSPVYLSHCERPPRQDEVSWNRIERPVSRVNRNVWTIFTGMIYLWLWEEIKLLARSNFYVINKPLGAYSWLHSPDLFFCFVR